MTEATEPDTAPMTPEYTGEFRTTKPTLASLTLDHLLRATFQNAELGGTIKNRDDHIKILRESNGALTAELQYLRDRLAKLDTPEVAELRERVAEAADLESSCALARNYAVKLQEKIDRLVKESSDAEKRLAELWEAATCAASTFKGVRGNAAQIILERLRASLEKTAIDCGQIPF